MSSFFSDHYNLVFSSIHEPEIQETDAIVCRFCSKSAPEVSFSKIAHAIPELLGNKTLFSKCECDTCNSFFGKTFENNLSEYLGIYRSIAGLLGKKGAPKYSTKDLKIEIKNNNRKIEIVSGKDIINTDEENNTVTIKAPNCKCIPIQVYKSFVKMALTVMPNEYLEEFSDTRKWLFETIEKPEFIRYAKVIQVFLSIPLETNRFECMVFIRKTDEVADIPYGIFILSFGNFIFQLALPAPKYDSDDLKMDLFTISKDPAIKYNANCVDLSSLEKQEFPNKITLTYTNLSEIPIEQIEMLLDENI